MLHDFCKRGLGVGLALAAVMVGGVPSVHAEERPIHEVRAAQPADDKTNAVDVAHVEPDAEQKMVPSQPSVNEPTVSTSHESYGAATTTSSANNSIYLELGGPAIIYSINYERRISDFNIRVGVGGAAFDGAGYLIAPVGFNYIGIGSDNHHLELGVTGNLGFVGNGFGDTVFFTSISPIVGYRLQGPDPGFMFRAGISPIVGAAGEGSLAFGFFPMPYVSFGANF